VDGDTHNINNNSHSTQMSGGGGTTIDNNKDNIATNKQSIYPISHIIVNSFADIGNAFSYNISVISMDLVTEDGANEQDVMHTQSMVGIRLCELLKRGDITDQNYVIEGNPSYEFFTDRFENKVAGCTTTFNVTVPNDMTIC
jgi:hypothetical protein